MINPDDIIHVEDEDWKVLSVSSEPIDGKYSLHLASLTRGQQQRNGWAPATIIFWLDESQI